MSLTGPCQRVISLVVLQCMGGLLGNTDVGEVLPTLVLHVPRVEIQVHVSNHNQDEDDEKRERE
jgi:hypothetical protein